MSLISKIGSLLALSLTLIACHLGVPKEALRLGPESLALRQLQTRRFETKDEKKLLQAGASLLQDMGFHIEESETNLGVLVGSKQADASNLGQIFGSIVIGAFIGTSPAVDKEQKVRASLVTRPLGASELALRVTFQRIVWDSQGQISRIESLKQSELYREFFEKLSKSVFLEAHAI